MNEVNFVQRMNSLVTGDMFLREVELPMLSAVRVAADGTVMTAATAPTLTTVGASFDDSDTALLHFDIPMDYAQEKDICAIRLHLIPAVADDYSTDMGITTAQSIYRAGAVVDSTASTAVAETAVDSTSLLTREAVLDISGRSYQPGDHVVLTLDANNETSGDELILLGVDLIYGGTLAAYNDDDRFCDLG